MSVLKYRIGSEWVVVGGFQTVVSDDSLSGDGTSSDPLKVADNPFTLFTAAPNGSINAYRLLARGDTTSVDLVLSPKGDGSILAHVPDGTATGGDKRGAAAVDLQTSRTTASQVASGPRSFISSGINNTASARSSVVSGGEGNIASGINSAVFGGELNVASGSTSFAAGRRAKAIHTGAFVLTDNQDADHSSTQDNEMRLRFANGVFINGDPVLTSETDPTVPAHVKAITETQIGNWDTAFGWGDHGAAGYIVGPFSDSIHGNRGGGSLHAVATPSVAGFLSAADKAKLDTLQKKVYTVTAANDDDATSTTLKDHPELFLVLPAGQYMLDMILPVDQPDGTGPNGMRYLFTGPSLQMRGARLGFGVNTFVGLDNLVTETTAAHGSTGILYLQFTAHFGMTAGTLQFRYAQNSSSANRLRIRSLADRRPMMRATLM